MIEIETPQQDLNELSQDRQASLLKNLLGTLPVLGPIVGDMLSNIIPNQRFDRFKNYILFLESRLTGRIQHLEDLIKKPENIKLFEQGLYQAIKETSEEKIKQIATCVADGISITEIEHIESERILKIFSELDELEVIVLSSYLRKNRDTDFRDKHIAALKKPMMYLGVNQKDIDRHAIMHAGELHLLRLGLLNQTEAKQVTYKITSLGLLLLRRIGLAEKEDI